MINVFLYIFLYIDDIVIVKSSNIEISTLKETLKEEFDMKYFGEAKIIMGMNIMRSHKKSEILLS